MKQKKKAKKDVEIEELKARLALLEARVQFLESRPIVITQPIHVDARPPEPLIPYNPPLPYPYGSPPWPDPFGTGPNITICETKPSASVSVTV